MLVLSIFPEAWVDAFVIFIPKRSGKGFRPISLRSTMCKLFERMVQRRLEFRAEKEEWIPRFQCGFWTGSSALDYISTVTTEIMRGLGDSEPTMILAIDIKSAFNLVLPGVLFENLIVMCCS